MSAHLDSRAAWRSSFGLLVSVPALVLAFLGMRAVRADRLEREQQWRDRQTQTAQLADAGIRNALAEIDEADDTIHFFSYDQSGRIAFGRDRVYFEKAPQTDPIEWPAQVEELVERARAAEIQRRPAHAVDAYKRILAVEPRLGGWARLALARIEKKDDAALLDQMGDEITPAGLPVALVAASGAGANKYRTLIERTHTRLQAGEWWLSFEERRFYEQQLRRLLAKPDAPDVRLQELASVARFARDVPLRREPARHFGRSDGLPMLILLAPSNGSATVWQGAAVVGPALDRLLSAVMTQVGARQLGNVRIADSTGKAIWGASFPEGHSESLSVIPGWRLSFERNVDAGWLDRRTILWLAFIVLLMVTMLASLAGTMRLARREAELARMQNDFIAGVSHDFKSPITGIRLLLERMASGRISSTEAAAQYQAAAERELTRLERHVNRLLEAQRIEAGQRRYDFAPASLSEIVSDAVAELTLEAEARQMIVQSESKALPVVRADRAAMTDAVANLLGNAIKYSPAGRRIHITTRADQSHAFIEVEDEGAGIDREDMKKIFRRFYRGRNQTGVNGTGLGLALVKATVQAHGGDLSATSAPGKGSRFTITLPLKAE